MSHTHGVHDTDARFVINPVTRQIKNESDRKTTLIQYDHNSERFTFEVPRHIEGHDMSQCNKVEIHYINVDARTKQEFKGVYLVDDLRIADDENIVICSWLISGGATRLIGKLSFIVRYACVDGNIVKYAWNTAMAGVDVSAGINSSDAVVADYSDVLEKWKAELFNAGYINAAAMQANIANLSGALDVERKRIDNIAKLPAGSTAGDAELADIRVGAYGESFDSAGSAVRMQIQKIADSEDSFRNDGFCYLKGGFEHGRIDNTGADVFGAFRIRSHGIVRYDRDITISIADGFKCVFHFYAADESYSAESGWVTGAYTIQGGTLFRVVIARVDEDETESANINDFIKALKITTKLTEVVADIKALELANKTHGESNLHLITQITSNNLVNPAEVIDGGYYVYNTGVWAARSDISTTGLIPCEKNKVYHCGVKNNEVRGGNCTFWNAGGRYVGGIDVIADGESNITIPNNDSIKYFRISLYTVDKSTYRVNLGELKEYDEYSCVYSFDKEISTPGFNSTVSEQANVHCYTQVYKDDVTVLHKRNRVVGTSYQVTVINKVKFDGTETKVTIAGTSKTSKLGDGNNANAASFAKANDFLHIINGGIYLVETGEADGITIIDGNILKSTGVEQFGTEQYVFGITKTGGMRAYINESAENVLKDGAVYAVTGFVPLIQNGVAVDNAVLAVCPHYNVRHPRQIVGVLADGNYFTFCCDGRTDGENGMTLKECIDTMTRDLAVQFAFNLDGGGSTQSAVGRKQINRVIDGRRIPNVIAFQ